ncbi:MAG: immunoglobulin domain-containing protein, partial [Limisphaerales bacterium]
FGPYGGNEEISNVIAGTTFDDVNSTNLPVFGIQPQSATNYSGNPLTLYAVASGVDLAYQWYDSSSPLSDGPNISGSTSDVLTINNLSASDTYYCQVTDADGNVLDSSNAVETVNTTPTPVFFPANATAATNSGNLFTTNTFQDMAQGTGPIYYQWFFAPTNLPITYGALSGQTNATLSLDLADYTYQGTYYLVASNAVDGGSIAIGPTNTLVELAPQGATLLQLRNLMVAIRPQILANEGGAVYINTNNVTVSGYVTTYGGFGTTYSEYNIQDAAGYGMEVYLGGHGNTNTPPVGSYVTVSGPVEVYDTQLEMAPASQNAIVTNLLAPVIPISPLLANDIFNDLATNGLGTNAILLGDKLLTFTNVYLYGTPNGGPFGSGYGPGSGGHDGIGGVFDPNSYTEIFFTANGPYDPATGNTNTMELYQYGEDYGNAAYGNYQINPFDDQPIPTNCFQLTGAYGTYRGVAEFEPSRLADYVANAPAPFVIGLSESNSARVISWQPQVGSTYSVDTATNILGPWTQAANGLTYYPTNGSFTDTNQSLVKFYYITSP